MDGAFFRGLGNGISEAWHAVNVGTNPLTGLVLIHDNLIWKIDDQAARHQPSCHLNRKWQQSPHLHRLIDNALLVVIFIVVIWRRTNKTSANVILPKGHGM